jgi:hypothetical protein
MDYDLGYFDDETCRLEPLPNPFGAKVINPAAGSDAEAPLASERLR